MRIGASDTMAITGGGSESDAPSAGTVVSFRERADACGIEVRWTATSSSSSTTG